MQPIKRFTLAIPAGYRSREAALFLAQLDNLSERMTRNLRELSKPQLAWQIAPGCNSIGMLLAHVAITEVFWIKHVMQADIHADEKIEEILGIDINGDGMPLDKEELVTIHLQKDLDHFVSLLQKARAFTTTIARTLTDTDMEKQVPVTVMDQPAIASVRWTLYHLLEHQAGHFGQMLLIKARIESSAESST